MCCGSLLCDVGLSYYPSYEWDRLKHLSKEQNKDPRAIQKEEKVGNPYTKSSTPTLNEVVQRWMKFKQSSSTKKKNILRCQEKSQKPHNC